MTWLSGKVGNLSLSVALVKITKTRPGMCISRLGLIELYEWGELIALEGGGLAGGEVPTGFAPIVPLPEGAK